MISIIISNIIWPKIDKHFKSRALMINGTDFLHSLLFYKNKYPEVLFPELRVNANKDIFLCFQLKLTESWIQFFYLCIFSLKRIYLELQQLCPCLFFA